MAELAPGDIAGAKFFEQEQQQHHQLVVEEQVAGAQPAADVAELELDAEPTSKAGKKKASSGLFKGLRRRKSGANLAEAGSNDSATRDDQQQGAAAAAATEAPIMRKKSFSSFLSLGKKKKAIALDADVDAADQGDEAVGAVDGEAIAAEQQQHSVVSTGLLGRLHSANGRRNSHPEESAPASTTEEEHSEEHIAAVAESSHSGDAAAPAESSEEGPSSPNGSATSGSVQTVSDASAGAATEGGATATTVAGGAGEIEGGDDDGDDEVDEEGVTRKGLLGRARSGNFSALLGRPKDEATLAAEAEAAAAAAEAEAAARAAAEAEAAARAARAEPAVEPPVRKFPRGFMWGTATSAYQIEGGWADEGKGMSIWDAFTHTPGKVTGGATGDVSACHFYRFREDVALMKSMGVKYYRMSISWSRIFPTGRGKVNERGVAFYDRLINELVAAKIMPVVTLYHWDLPLALQVEEDGWLNPKIVDHFVKYAKTCFARFGDRVKYWITVNEPWCAAVLGHDSGGQHAPGRTVDPAREVYRVAHHMLIAHGRTYQMYQRAFKRKQRGKIGMALNGDWYEAKPAADLGEQRRNEKAAERALEFTVGWFARPVYQGDYPSLMRERCGDRLPRFTAEQRATLVGSCDFFGLNHYSSHLCEQPAWYKELAPQQDEDERENRLMKLGAQLERMMTAVTGRSPGSDAGEIQEGDVGEPQPDAKVQVVGDDAEIPRDAYIESTGYWQDISVDQSDDDVWKTTDMGWGVHPEGMRKMLNYIQREFAPRGGVIITENGCAVAEDGEEEALKDIERAVYLKRYLTEVHKALLHDDVDVRGYFVWSLLDNFEWGYGYTKKFGLHYVDMQTLERVPKMSANWYAEVIKKNRLEALV